MKTFTGLPLVSEKSGKFKVREKSGNFETRKSFKKKDRAGLGLLNFGH